MYRWLLAGLLGLTFTLSASAATYRYGTPVSVTGTLGSRQGVDCCNMGKEEVVEFPAIILDHPINTIPADRMRKVRSTAFSSCSLSWETTASGSFIKTIRDTGPA